jgi:predicted alpha/beta-fold hydrolase
LTPTLPPYASPWWLPGGHLQTIVGALLPAPRIVFRRERWETPDGDFIDLDWAGDGNGGPLLALFHGLEGSSRSPYARSIAARVSAAGWRCVVPHFRGCSGELNRLPRAYHSGDSTEIGWILSRLKPRFAVGVSLGGNALLKYLGEQGATAVVEKAVAVSAPLNLSAAGAALDRGISKNIYTRMFLKTLRTKSLEKLARHPGAFDGARVRAATTFREFDDAVTAPLHGFLGYEDYWTRSSSAQYLHGIRVPTLVLNARNDPFLPDPALRVVEGLGGLPANLSFEFPATGGHVGFPGRNGWLAQRIHGFLAT